MNGQSALSSREASRSQKLVASSEQLRFVTSRGASHQCDETEGKREKLGRLHDFSLHRHWVMADMIPILVENAQIHPFVSNPALRPSFWINNGQIICSNLKLVPPQPVYKSSSPNYVRDPRYQAEGRSFESVALGPTSDPKLVPPFDERFGNQQHDDAMSSSTNPLDTFAVPNGTGKQNVPYANYRVNSSSFCTLTIDDEEEKRRMLGLPMETNFPESSDIFMGCEKYNADLDEPSSAGGNATMQVDTFNVAKKKSVFQ